MAVNHILPSEISLPYLKMK